MSRSDSRIKGGQNFFKRIDLGCKILRIESEALSSLADHLDIDFAKAVDILLQINGSVVVTGMGKAGLIGQKIVATLASTGTCSHFLHPAEAMHGDLGRIGEDDIVLALSHSGETDEMSRLLPSLANSDVPIIAITGNPESTLARAATVVLDIGRLQEADPLGLAPSTSTTAMLAVGDALALVASQEKGFRSTDFAKLHPAGSLGRKLATVDELMRPLGMCRVANDDESVRAILVHQANRGRRTGAILLLDTDQKLAGIFTDSDLARLLESENDGSLDGPVSAVMTQSPKSAKSGSMMEDAVHVMAREKISELPVIDDDNVPLGVLDITDVVGFLPHESQSSQDRPTASAEPEKLTQAPNKKSKSA